MPETHRQAQTFAVGDRVVVVANAFDVPQISADFGPMAGHYGKVVTVDWNDVDPGHGPRQLIGVDILGRIDDEPVRWTKLESHGLGPRSRWWFFHDTELEHAD